MTRRPLVPGWCLMCRNSGMVVWVGPVEHDGQTAPVYACESCCDYLREYIAFYTQQRDMSPAQ